MTSYTGINWMLAEKLISQMSTRFGSNMEEKSVLAVATLLELDPRFKKLLFSNNEAVERMTREIVNYATTLTTPVVDPRGQQMQTTSTSTSDESIKPNPVWEAFDIEAVESTSRRMPTISTLTEVEQYFKQPIINTKKTHLNGGATMPTSFLSYKKLQRCTCQLWQPQFLLRDFSARLESLSQKKKQN